MDVSETELERIAVVTVRRCIYSEQELTQYCRDNGPTQASQPKSGRCS